MAKRSINVVVDLNAERDVAEVAEDLATLEGYRLFNYRSWFNDNIPICERIEVLENLRDIWLDQLKDAKEDEKHLWEKRLNCSLIILNDLHFNRFVDITQVLL